MEEERKWSKAGLRISGEELHPDQVEALLVLKPTRVHLRGQPRNPRREDRWPESLWYLESPLRDELDMVKHLQWLLDSLEPKREILGLLSKKFRVDVFCGFFFFFGQGGFVLDAAILERLAGLRVPLVLDLYPPTAGKDVRY